MSLRVKIVYMSLLAGLSLQPVVADDDTGPYFGVGINRLSAHFEDESDIDFEESDNAISAKAGYMFTDFIGIEIGYIDLGSYQAEGDVVGNRIDLDADGISTALVLNWSVIDQLDLYGKLGVYRLNVESTSVIAGNQLSTDNDEDELFGAIGIEYDLGTANLFTEISIADTDINDLSITIASAGLKFEF